MTAPRTTPRPHSAAGGGCVTGYPKLPSLVLTGSGIWLREWLIRQGRRSSKSPSVQAFAPRPDITEESASIGLQKAAHNPEEPGGTDWQGRIHELYCRGRGVRVPVCRRLRGPVSPVHRKEDAAAETRGSSRLRRLDHPVRGAAGISRSRRTVARGRRSRVLMFVPLLGAEAHRPVCE